MRSMSHPEYQYKPWPEERRNRAREAAKKRSRRNSQLQSVKQSVAATECPGRSSDEFAHLMGLCVSVGSSKVVRDLAKYLAFPSNFRLHTLSREQMCLLGHALEGYCRGIYIQRTGGPEQ